MYPALVGGSVIGTRPVCFLPDDDEDEVSTVWEGKERERIGKDRKKNCEIFRIILVSSGPRSQTWMIRRMKCASAVSSMDGAFAG
jgi:hypothetical protein